jgi:predicted RNase H-like HicB family nuclease
MPTLTAVIERDPESGWFIGSIPQLPGAHSQAATLEELRTNLAVAARLVITDMLEHGEELPDSEFVSAEPITVQP